MLVTREMDYGIRVIRALYFGGMLSAMEIARREHMKKAITYKVIGILKEAGILGSVRGAEGGYELKISCKELTLYDVFNCFKGNQLLTECLEEGYQCPNRDGKSCGPHRELMRIQQIMYKELKKTPLEKLFTS